MTSVVSVACISKVGITACAPASSLRQQKFNSAARGEKPVWRGTSLCNLTELCKAISEGMRSRASRLWQCLLSRKNLSQQSCISTCAWNCISWTWTAKYYGTKGSTQEMHEGWRNQSPEQGKKYTTTILICFGPGKIIMELTGYLRGCVKDT